MDRSYYIQNYSLAEHIQIRDNRYIDYKSRIDSESITANKNIAYHYKRIGSYYSRVSNVNMYAYTNKISIADQYNIIQRLTNKINKEEESIILNRKNMFDIYRKVELAMKFYNECIDEVIQLEKEAAGVGYSEPVAA